jgi:signal transduction histidine kinase/CheY-like chemotaxis protein
MLRPSGTYLSIIVIPLVLLMLATAAVALHSARALENSHELVNKTNQIIQQTQQLEILSQDAETGQRGYLITGNEKYLNPYKHAQSQLPITIDNLRDLLSNNPSQMQRLQTLVGYIDVKLAELAQTIELRRSKGFDAAREVVTNDAGQAAMDEIRTRVNDMGIAENTLLEQRLTAAHDAEENTFLVTAGLFAVLLALCLGGGLIFLRNFGRLAHAENELEIKARLLQTTLDTVAEGIGAFGPDNRLVAWNKKFFDLFNFPFILGHNESFLDDFITYDRESGGCFTAAASLPSVDSHPVLGVYELADQRTVEVYRSVMPAGGMVFTARDVTESKHAEIAVRQAQKMESIGQLTGGIAHDFNNLLQIIIANLDLVLRKISDEAVQKRVKDALIGAERGSKLTRQLLAFARRQPLKPEPVNLARMMRDLTELLRRSLGENIEIEEIVAAGIWHALADRSQIENAVVNLAINARDAMENGGKLIIELSNAFLDEAYARYHDDVKPGQYVMIAVSDTGSGMDKETIARAFDPFFSTKPEGKGTGLGLSMVYGFVKQSGGHIKIYSELGVGTTIKLYLPRSIQTEAPQVIAPDDKIGGHGETILIVEDDPSVQAAVVLMIQDLGYKTLQAGSGAETLEILQSSQPIDLMFTDVVMPGEMQGRKLAAAAKELRPNLKIVFTSGYTENSIVHNGRLDDGVHLISKPYRKNDLVRKLRTVLDEKSASAKPLPKSESKEEVLSTPALNRKRTILFAEDDALVRMATMDMLEDMGYHVFPAHDLSTAMKLLEKERLDIMIVDINLGKADGSKLAEAANAVASDLKIIFATGRDPGDLITRFPGAKVLTKPYGLPELQAALDFAIA